MSRKNIFTKETVDEQFSSKCMYCGSTSYGSGCIYSAHGRHIHVDEPGRCAYCGSLSYGSGCIYNPFNNMHVHGADMSGYVRESTRKTVELSYILDRLLESNTDTEAYKCGLIDKTGKQLRVPLNAHEHMLVSPLSKAIYRLRKFLPEDAISIRESYKLMLHSTQLEESVEEYKSAISVESDIRHAVKHLTSTLRESYNKISPEKIEKIIEDAILDSTE